jgi:hypothetical protein
VRCPAVRPCTAPAPRAPPPAPAARPLRGCEPTRARATPAAPWG